MVKIIKENRRPTVKKKAESNYAPVPKDLSTLIKAMEAAGYYYDVLSSREGYIVFDYDGMTTPLEFYSWKEVRDWLEGVTFDDPDRSDGVEKIMHPGRFRESNRPTAKRKAESSSKYGLTYNIDRYHRAKIGRQTFVDHRVWWVVRIYDIDRPKKDTIDWADSDYTYLGKYTSQEKAVSALLKAYPKATLEESKRPTAKRENKSVLDGYLQEIDDADGVDQIDEIMERAANESDDALSNMEYEKIYDKGLRKAQGWQFKSTSSKKESYGDDEEDDRSDLYLQYVDVISGASSYDELIQIRAEIEDDYDYDNISEGEFNQLYRMVNHKIQRKFK